MTNIRVSFETSKEEEKYTQIRSEDVTFKEPKTVEELADMLREISIRSGFSYIRDVELIKWDGEKTCK